MKQNPRTLNTVWHYVRRYGWFLAASLLLAVASVGMTLYVPVLIGEFTCFEDKEAWDFMLGKFDERHYSWTVWNYKTTVTGWWTSSWGVYTCQLKLDTGTEELKCNVATCTYEEFIAACEKTRTENCVTSTLWEVLETYNSK